MSQGACNCCAQPICPVPQFACDSVSVSKSKCGFAEYGAPSSPPKIYRKKETTRDGSFSGNRTGVSGAPPCDTADTGSYDFSATVHRHTIDEYDLDTCALSTPTDDKSSSLTQPFLPP